MRVATIVGVVGAAVVVVNDLLRSIDELIWIPLSAVGDRPLGALYDELARSQDRGEVTIDVVGVLLPAFLTLALAVTIASLSAAGRLSATVAVLVFLVLLAGGAVIALASALPLRMDLADTFGVAIGGTRTAATWTLDMVALAGLIAIPALGVATAIRGARGAAS